MRRIVITALFLTQVLCKILPPPVTIRALKPKGFIVSIPADDPGITKYEIECKVNDKISFTRPGNIREQLTKREDGRWSYRNDDVELKLGDILYYRYKYVKYKEGVHSNTKQFLVQDKISMYVDGENYGEVQPEGSFYDDASKLNVTLPTKWREGTKMAPFDEMFYISLGLSVGGHREYPESVSKPWSNDSSRAMFDFWITNPLWLNTWYQETSSLQVDYVRVYAL